MSVLGATSGILLMVRRSLRQHALSSLVTIMSVALATGLLMSVFSIRAQTHNAFTSASSGFDAVLGARGSKLQLVLNSVFHLETSPGNIPWSSYEAIRKDPRVKHAIPYAVGDNFKGYRMVGTTTSFFDLVEIGKGQKLKLAEGERYFKADRFEAVLGSIVADQTKLGIGDVFNSYHGMTFDESAKHASEFHVVGVLEPTGTPIDRVIWIPIDGYYYMEGHAPVDKKSGRVVQIDKSKPIPDEYKEVSSVMLILRSPAMGQSLDVEINRQGTVRTFAWPIGTVMAELFNKIAWANKVLELVGYLVMLVAGAAILASIYNTMNERRREFAILRALGARRGTVFSAIVCESATIAFLGTLAGYVVYFVLVSVAAHYVRLKAGVVLDPWKFHESLKWTPIGMIGLGALTGIVPALKAYSTDVASNLVPVS